MRAVRSNYCANIKLMCASTVMCAQSPQSNAESHGEANADESATAYGQNLILLQIASAWQLWRLTLCTLRGRGIALMELKSSDEKSVKRISTKEINFGQKMLNFAN